MPDATTSPATPHRARRPSGWRRAATSPPLLLAAGALALALLFFGEVLLGGRVYYPGDVARIYLPLRIELRRALSAGSLPWWSPRVGAGYPLLAEGEVGALYPPNWLTATLFHPAVGTSVSVVLHYALAGAGAFLFLRALGRSRAGAALGAVVGSLGGYSVAHLSHVSVLHASVWVPWALLFTHRLLAGPPGPIDRRATVGLTLAVALQLLAGHAQMALLALAPLGGYALCVGVPNLSVAAGRRRLATWAAALAAGAVLAAPQLVPTIQLGALSQRAGGLEDAFFTSYSFHPLLTATFVSPFALGNPYPEGSVELMGYVGLAPLGLAAVALIRTRGRVTWFFAGLGLVGLALAFGRWNPLYAYLRYVPVVNLFRVPARYLFWTTLAAVVLAAAGVDVLRQQAPRRWAPGGAPAAAGVLLAAVAAAGAAVALDLEALVAAWRWMPAVLGAGTLAAVLGARAIPGRPWAAVVMALLVADLYAYGAVLDETYNASLDADRVAEEPASVAYLRGQPGLYRVYTKEEILPALSVQRESLYPNIAMAHGVSGANLYLPLVPRSYGEYLSGLTPGRLDRLNVRFYLIPQLLPVDEASELYDVHNPFAALPTDAWLVAPAGRVAAVEVESYLSHSTHLADGEPAADILLRDGEGRIVELPLRVGIETAEWAYRRSDVLEAVAHSLPDVATTFEARSGFPPEDHAGHTYLARYELPEPADVEAALVRLHLPAAFTRVERVTLIGEGGERTLLSHVVGLGNHTLVYRSEDVLIYRNEDAWPRAYAVPVGRAERRGMGLWLDGTLRAGDLWDVRVAVYGDALVELEAELPGAGYVVLGDLAYPGWYAAVDGEPVPIIEVDGAFRGVRVEAGSHRIVFRYRPLRPG